MIDGKAEFTWADLRAREAAAEARARRIERRAEIGLALVLMIVCAIIAL